MIKMYLLFCNDDELMNNYYEEVEKYQQKDEKLFVFNRGSSYITNKELYYDDKSLVEENNFDFNIFTNDETMLDYMSTDLFNGRNSHPDLFIQDTKSKKLKFISIKDYSENGSGREIRVAHNLRKLIIANEFNNFKYRRNK